MIYLNDVSNQNVSCKDFEQVIASKDINKIKICASKGPKLYKNILNAIEKDLELYIYEQSNQLALKFSPDAQTAALLISEKACLSQKEPPQFNLSLQVLRADKNGCFHKTEKFAYAFYEEISFERLDDDILVMKKGEMASQPILKALKQLPEELKVPRTLAPTNYLSAEDKIQFLKSVKNQYRSYTNTK